MSGTDLTESEWRIIETILLERPQAPRRRGGHGRWRDLNRTLVNGIFWKLRTGREWRMVPPRYGKWNSIYQHYRRWGKSGVWARIDDALADRSPEVARGKTRLAKEHDYRSIR